MEINQFMYQFLNRSESLFKKDLEDNRETLESEIKGKKILVIGGAGTIGSSFIKAALNFQPKSVVVVDINENALTEFIRDIRSTINQFIPEELLTYPLSFDSKAFFKLFKYHGPFDIVANFAAHKHVRSEKDIYSIEALLENNLIKAKGLLDFLIQHPPKHFFCVSTDKAANPVNVMGASKKVMEELILAYSNEFKVTTARFANVAFSNGSLLEGFLKRIDKKQPLSCPADVTRFFVTPQESGEICLLACILGKTREIFFPKLDMERDLINFADIFPEILQEYGYTSLICNSEDEARISVDQIQHGKYPVYIFKTDTSGEKLYEEFYTDDEDYYLDKFNMLGYIKKDNKHSINSIGQILQDLSHLLSSDDTQKADVIQWLHKYIPEFEHIETGLSLDKKM